MTELEKMEAGEIYDFWDDEVEARKNFAIVKCAEYNAIDPMAALSAQGALSQRISRRSPWLSEALQR